MMKMATKPIQNSKNKCPSALPPFRPHFHFRPSNKPNLRTAPANLKDIEVSTQRGVMQRRGTHLQAMTAAGGRGGICPSR